MVYRVYAVLGYLATASIGAGAGLWLAIDRPISGAIIGGLTGAGVRVAARLLEP